METRRAGGTVPGQPAAGVIPIRAGLAGKHGQAAEEQRDDHDGERGADERPGNGTAIADGLNRLEPAKILERHDFTSAFVAYGVS